MRNQQDSRHVAHAMQIVGLFLTNAFNFREISRFLLESNLKEPNFPIPESELILKHFRFCNYEMLVPEWERFYPKFVLELNLLHRTRSQSSDKIVTWNQHHLLTWFTKFKTELNMSSCRSLEAHYSINFDIPVYNFQFFLEEYVLIQKSETDPFLELSSKKIAVLRRRCYESKKTRMSLLLSKSSEIIGWIVIDLLYKKQGNSSVSSS